MYRTYRAGLALALAGGLASPALAAHLKYYQAPLTALNESGVTGDVYLTFDGPEDDGMSTLDVQVRASGLEPGAHAAHIHGFTDPFMESVAPVAGVFDPDTDGDSDGFTELGEGADFYGPIQLTFEGLAADAMGNVDYEMSFDIDPTGPLFDPAFALSSREIVLHGMTTDFAVGGPGEVDTSLFQPGTPNPFLPVATGEIVAVAGPAPVPLPAAAWMLIAGLGGLGAMARRRRG